MGTEIFVSVALKALHEQYKQDDTIMEYLKLAIFKLIVLIPEDRLVDKEKIAIIHLAIIDLAARIGPNDCFDYVGLLTIANSIMLFSKEKERSRLSGLF